MSDPKKKLDANTLRKLRLREQKYVPFFALGMVLVGLVLTLFVVHGPLGGGLFISLGFFGYIAHHMATMPAPEYKVRGADRNRCYRQLDNSRRNLGIVGFVSILAAAVPGMLQNLPYLQALTAPDQIWLCWTTLLVLNAFFLAKTMLYEQMMRFMQGLATGKTFIEPRNDTIKTNWVDVIDMLPILISTIFSMSMLVGRMFNFEPPFPLISFDIF